MQVMAWLHTGAKPLADLRLSQCLYPSRGLKEGSQQILFEYIFMTENDIFFDWKSSSLYSHYLDDDTGSDNGLVPARLPSLLWSNDGH